MIEMLMAAFILSIGLLGLTALQSAALTTSTRAKGYYGAVNAAGYILENIESQARQRTLTRINDPLAVLPVYTPDYFGADPAQPVLVNENLTFNGHYPNAAAVNVVDQNTFFKVSTSGPATVHPVAATTSAYRNYTVTVTFTEIGPGNIKIPRSVAISRMVVYGL